MNSNSRSIPIALTIAGSDSGGGAGIQADLRTFAFHCVHGTSAITCVTAQNTLGVTRVDALPTAAIIAQIEAVITDLPPRAAKTGMLLNQEIIATVAEQIEIYKLANLVVDPVMVSRTGAQLIDNAAVAILRDRLIPKAVLVTPNRYEAQILSGLPVHSLDDMRAAAQRIYQQAGVPILIKGGGLTGEARGVDIWFDGKSYETLKTTAVDTPHTHGTGCTLAAAIASQLALGQDLLPAIRLAKEYVTKALQHALAIGQGTGPIGHFFPLLQD